VIGVDVIVTAQAAGAGAGGGDVAKAALMDVYGVLRDGLRHRLVGRTSATRALELEAADPEVWRARLEADLIDSGAADDEVILAAARRLLELALPKVSSPGKYVIDVREAKGVQIGDSNIQRNTFY
jgi:hypothetical protein